MQHLLFPSLHNAEQILPCDGDVTYLSAFLSSQNADHYHEKLFEQVQWQPDKFKRFGDIIETKRQYAWMADAKYSYRYSGFDRIATLFSPLVKEIKTSVEEACGESFNSCLLNLYRDGTESMSWHSDDETELKRHGTIASLSLGANRDFVFKHKRSNEKAAVLLEHGSLLVMRNTTQSNWLHALPARQKVKTQRINLTFRQYVKS